MGDFLRDNDIYRDGRQYDWHFKEKEDDLTFYLRWMKKLVLRAAPAFKLAHTMPCDSIRPRKSL